MNQSLATSHRITEEQIDQACEIFRAQLSSHADEFRSNDVQITLGQAEYGQDLLAAHRRRVEAVSQSFMADVAYDPAWQTIDRSRYAYVGDVQARDYPETSTGRKPVRFRELSFDHNVLDEEILATAEREGCRQPTRAEVETAIRTHYTSEELDKNPRIGLIGSAVRRDGELNRAYVLGSADGVKLDWYWTADRWSRYCRFLVVCK